MAQVFHKKDMPFAYGKYQEDEFKVGKGKERRIQTVTEVIGVDFEYIKIAIRQEKVEFRGTAKDIFESRKRVLGRLKTRKTEIKKEVVLEFDEKLERKKIKVLEKAHVKANEEVEIVGTSVKEAEETIKTTDEALIVAKEAVEAFGEIDPNGFDAAKEAVEAFGEIDPEAEVSKGYVDAMEVFKLQKAYVEAVELVQTCETAVEKVRTEHEELEELLEIKKENFKTAETAVEKAIEVLDRAIEKEK